MGLALALPGSSARFLFYEHAYFGLIAVNGAVEANGQFVRTANLKARHAECLNPSLNDNNLWTSD